MSEQEELLKQVSDCMDLLESELRLYDQALRFAEANYPREASVFSACREIVRKAGLPDFSSDEHSAMVQALRERVSRALQDRK